MLQTLREDFTSSLDPSRHISLLALSSTISRLASGLLSDYMSSPNRRHPISRIPLLVLLSTLHFSAFFILAYAPISWVRQWFSVGSILVGTSYGGIFTLAPTVVSVVWGVGGFGRNWGILTFTPGTLSSDLTSLVWTRLMIALGAVIFGLLYARIYDVHSPAPPGICAGRECWKTTALSAGWACLFATLLLLFVWHKWQRRGWMV